MKQGIRQTIWQTMNERIKQSIRFIQGECAKALILFFGVTTKGDSDDSSGHTIGEPKAETGIE